jgi:hypothetical protein
MVAAAKQYVGAEKIAKILIKAGAKLHYPGNVSYKPKCDPIWFPASYASLDYSQF